MDIYMETFGCTFNQADTQIMAALLEKAGYKLVDKIEIADLLVLNTCYVKKPTEQKLINRISTLTREHPHKKILVGGCMVEIDPERLDKLSKDASWIGPHQVASVTEVVREIEQGKIVRLTGSSEVIKSCLPKKRENPLIHIIQISEGCSGICSYCCTRFARGKLNSYPISMLKQEAEVAIKEGVVELQITAQDTAAYGVDTETTLSELINQITIIKGDFRLRVGMMHPQSLIRDFLPLIESFRNEKVYKFLHLPIQSGNEKVLEDMNRGYGPHDIKRMVTKFREKIPGISLATDIIVGYPTENEEAFQDTLEVVRQIKPDFLHISKYQHRPGAVSSNLDEINHAEMKKRSKNLNQLKTMLALEKNQKLVGTNQNILITSKGSKGGYLGRTNSYKTVIVPEANIGTFMNVKIIRAKSTYLEGKPLIN